MQLFDLDVQVSRWLDFVLSLFESTLTHVVIYLVYILHTVYALAFNLYMSPSLVFYNISNGITSFVHSVQVVLNALFFDVSILTSVETTLISVYTGLVASLRELSWYKVLAYVYFTAFVCFLAYSAVYFLVRTFLFTIYCFVGVFVGIPVFVVCTLWDMVKSIFQGAYQAGAFARNFVLRSFILNKEQDVQKKPFIVHLTFTTINAKNIRRSMCLGFEAKYRVTDLLQKDASLSSYRIYKRPVKPSDSLVRLLPNDALSHEQQLMLL